MTNYDGSRQTTMGATVTENPVIARYDPTAKQRGAEKTSRIPIKVIPIKPEDMLKKPSWIRVRASVLNSRFSEIKKILRENDLHTVCEEGACPNIGECFGLGTATFMIMGDKCTRRCPFCDVGHGRPDPLNDAEPEKLAATVAKLNLNYVVITSVDRDDLKDGGAAHFARCIAAIRQKSPQTKIEVLVPDFRGRLDRALDILVMEPPDVMNHNLETVPRLYREVRPGADYLHSLMLLKQFKARLPHVPTKSGIMLGLGEGDAEIAQVLRDMREHDIDRVTIGQYLAPSTAHLAVKAYVTPEKFKEWQSICENMGFAKAQCGPLVRSSYHAADLSAE